MGVAWGFRWAFHFHEGMLCHILLLPQLPLCFADLPTPRGSLLPSVLQLVSSKLCFISKV